MSWNFVLSGTFMVRWTFLADGRISYMMCVSSIRWGRMICGETKNCFYMEVLDH